MDSPHDWFAATLGGYLAYVWVAATLVAVALATASALYAKLRRAWRRRRNPEAGARGELIGGRV